MCEALSIQRSGFYAWVDKPKLKRQLKDERLMGLIKHSWLESGCVYGYRKVTSDLNTQTSLSCLVLAITGI